MHVITLLCLQNSVTDIPPHFTRDIGPSCRCIPSVQYDFVCRKGKIASATLHRTVAAGKSVEQLLKTTLKAEAVLLTLANGKTSFVLHSNMSSCTLLCGFGAGSHLVV